MTTYLLTKNKLRKVQGSNMKRLKKMISERPRTYNPVHHITISETTEYGILSVLKKRLAMIGVSYEISSNNRRFGQDPLAY